MSICWVKSNGLKIHPKRAAAAPDPTCQSAEAAAARPSRPAGRWVGGWWAQDACGRLGIAGQMTGAERSLVTVGRSRTVANGFPPLWRNRRRREWRANVLCRKRRSAAGDLRQESGRRSEGAVGLARLGREDKFQDKIWDERQIRKRIRVMRRKKWRQNFKFTIRK